MTKEEAGKILEDSTCPGCSRHEIHKMCPAYGTKYYMSGILLTKELEEENKEDRDKVLRMLINKYSTKHFPL